ncbi:MAG: DNA polymerase IV, partial [Blautia sp.]|nr:DNA polymerase IV [Blautia sp.]
MRTIFHVDVNSAFLSWSALKQLTEDPHSVDLRTIPSAVGGDVETRHGIITAKSIPAKKYGIQTGEPVVKALAKCPDLVLVKSDFAVYRDYSSRLMELLREYTPVLQQASIDEAYLDVSALLQDNDAYSNPERLAREIADHVKTSLGFTVNVGISSNKFLAKMASDFEKPDKIHTLWPEEIRQKMWPLPIGKLYGCGKATAARLQNLGIYTIGDAASADLSLLQGNLGQKAGLYIIERANGIDKSEVHAEERDAKSYSNETTTAEDITRDNYNTLALPILKKLSEKVAGRLQRDNVWGSTVSVIVKTGAFRRHTRQTTLNAPTNDAEEIYSQTQTLLYDLLYGKKGGTDRSPGLFSQGDVLRLIGVGVSNLDNGENRQM